MKKDEIKWIVKGSETKEPIHILFNPDKRFLGHQDLYSPGATNGKDVVLTIKSMGYALVFNTSTKRESEKKAIEFFETDEWIKPFICNETNTKMIFKVTGCKFMHELTGKKIQIGIDKTEVKKEMVDCLRVRNILSANLEKMQCISQEQVQQIKDLLSMQTEVTENNILSALKINDLNALPVSKFQATIKRLNECVDKKNNDLI